MTNQAGRLAKLIAAAGLLIVVVCFTDQDSSPLLRVYTTEITAEDFPQDYPFDPEPLFGKYELTFAKGNRHHCTLDGEFLVEGSQTFTEERIEFNDDKGGVACARTPGWATGTYKWKLEGDKLTFKVIEDKCLPRRFCLTARPWEKKQ